MLEDFELMGLMFVDPGVVSQIPLSRTIFHGFRDPNPGVQTIRVHRKAL